ncbi:NitT/TauT family transport system substrate-binding protein [Breoghania corrubedonensis]|uniref:NitT/TauT family transport system substrate-binding protein n=1 Tax=Breoghania corrubedonensis TaxID=665038 RepID=A0A2T5V6N7_9HYPH|nr:ABC transporter substrate-binding protein [Breoghania corrubedonensis]PTW59396.1 NitT/TauT family transport system substrate-binding protein [Breoghania corrubedonensis]
MQRLITACLGALAVLMAATFAQAAPEKQKIVVGLPVTSATFLPLFLADERGYFKNEGVDVDIVTFRGGTNMVRGMIAGNVDIGVTALAGVSVGIKAGQPIKAFYGGFNMALFEWYAVKGITSIEETKGKRFGVTSLGSSTDFLTRYALKLNGIDPEKDVQIIAAGGSGDRLPAMETSQLEVNILAPPYTFKAADLGYNRIVSQKDLAPDFPFHVFFATDDFREKNPETIRAFLRGLVRGIRDAKADRAGSIQVLAERTGLNDNYAGRAYDAFIDSIYEDGRMPSEAGMKAFWEMGILGGAYDEAWPEAKYLDRTFIDSYAQWKPGT